VLWGVRIMVLLLNVVQLTVFVLNKPSVNVLG
jgi:hypothetical protein